MVELETVTAILVTHDQDEAFVFADQVGVLQEGRLAQIGAPESIYHNPATPFVAEFVSAADFLPGVVTEEPVMTEIGVFANANGRPAGARVSVMIRPDDVTFVPDPAGDAVIVRRYFRGSENLYCLGLPSGQRVHSSPALFGRLSERPAGAAPGPRPAPRHVSHVTGWRIHTFGST
jgi:iron(III) transport system ATP-binding protein